MTKRAVVALSRMAPIRHYRTVSVFGDRPRPPDRRMLNELPGLSPDKYFLRRHHASRAACDGYFYWAKDRKTARNGSSVGCKNFRKSSRLPSAGSPCWTIICTCSRVLIPTSPEAGRMRKSSGAGDLSFRLATSPARRCRSPIAGCNGVSRTSRGWPRRERGCKA